MRHWIEQEIFLDPDYLVIKILSSIDNIGIDFIPSKYPSAGAFGDIPLPAAFLKCRPIGCAEIIQYLQSLTVATPDTFEQASLRALVESVLSEAISFSLWGHEECYSQFTWPVMKDSLSRPFADLYCRNERAKWVHKDSELLNRKIRNVFETLGNKILVSKFLLSNDNPTFVDILVYSYLSVLIVSIPEKFAFFDQDPELVQRLKSYLLDFDDWLWQRASDVPLIPSGEGPSTSAKKETVETAKSEAATPFLGKDYETKKANIIFLTGTAVSMAAIGYLVA